MNSANLATIQDSSIVMNALLNQSSPFFSCLICSLTSRSHSYFFDIFLILKLFDWFCKAKWEIQFTSLHWICGPGKAQNRSALNPMQTGKNFFFFEKSLIMKLFFLSKNRKKFFFFGFTNFFWWIPTLQNRPQLPQF